MDRLKYYGRVMKVLLVVANVFLLILCLLAIGLGSFLLGENLNLDYLTGDPVFNGAVALIIIGVVVTLAAVLGIAAGISGKLGVVTMNSLCVFGLLGLGVTAAIFSFASGYDISDRAQDQFITGISAYRREIDSDYNSEVNLYVDWIQKTFHCCGFSRPEDWILKNPNYCIANQGLPNSCSCGDDENADDCNFVYVPIPFGGSVGFSSWTDGCEDSIDAMTSNEVVIAGSVSIFFVLIEVLAMCCSLGLCVLRIHHNIKERRTAGTYSPINPFIDQGADYGSYANVENL